MVKYNMGNHIHLLLKEEDEEMGGITREYGVSRK